MACASSSSRSQCGSARDGDELIVLDRETGSRIGKIDTHGGGGLLPDHKPSPPDTRAEYRQRLGALRREYTDEKMALLAEARARVPERFVASSPGGITMNTYTLLRGREQAMIDFYERPEFVADAMMMQAEAIADRAERLLTTGIDCLYIGDPASSASLISPRHFERFCLPAYQQFCRHFRGRDVLIYIHICGNSRPILEMMADTGADTVEPLDPLGGVEVVDAKSPDRGAGGADGWGEHPHPGRWHTRTGARRGDPQMPRGRAAWLHPGGWRHGPAGHTAG